MYGLKDLKPEIEVEDGTADCPGTVSCPVRGCERDVERQRVKFVREKRYFCQDHGIYISPTTFEYEDVNANLLWSDKESMELLSEIVHGPKRESRMARDNSEDSVTWNVFRFLEKNGLVPTVLGELLGADLSDPKLVYWSHCQESGTLWTGLRKARLAFGEPAHTGSEPDLIVYAKNALLFVESKLTSGNKTVPARNYRGEKYGLGADGWARNVCRLDCKTMAIDEKKYELMRFWILGTWLASEMGVPFHLVNLVRAGQEEPIEATADRLFVINTQNHFQRITWENLLAKVDADCEADSSDATKLLDYAREKTIGYGPDRKIRPAFKCTF